MNERSWYAVQPGIRTIRELLVVLVGVISLRQLVVVAVCDRHDTPSLFFRAVLAGIRE